MRYQVLGSLQVCTGAAWSHVRADQQRAVLAVLLIEAGHVVSTDRIIDELWGPCPPRSAANAVQVYVMRLRKLIGRDSHHLIVTRGHGYELQLEDDDLDAAVFEGFVSAGLQWLTTGRIERAIADLGRALSLWRGSALADVPATPTVTAARARLEQRRVTALEQMLGAELERDRHVAVVDELFQAVQRYPLNEQLRAHLMVALRRCGRRAEALEVYRRGRAVLKEELGLEPNGQLRELHQALLAE
jgi:DNA-binding SARP family transcriptional activator